MQFPADHPGLSRRQFASNIAMACVGICLGNGSEDSSTFVSRISQRPKNLIYLHLSGGMSHLDTFDPKPENPAVMGNTGVIPTCVEGISLGHHLPLTAKLADQLYIINSMQTDCSSTHDEAVAQMNYRFGKPGQELEFQERILVSSLATRGEKFSALDYNGRNLAMVDQTNRMFHQRFQNPALQNRPHSRVAENFGAACDAAVETIENGRRSVHIEFPGWDTHIDHFTGLAGRCREFDQAFSKLINDLIIKGRLQHTLVVVATEFGRTPKIQAAHRNGRDHHFSAFSCVLAGAGIIGGVRYGRTDENGDQVIENPVSFDEFNDVISDLLTSSDSPEMAFQRRLR